MTNNVVIEITPSAGLHAGLPQDTMVIVAGGHAPLQLLTTRIRSWSTDNAGGVHVGRNGYEEAYGKEYNADVDNAA